MGHTLRQTLRLGRDHGEYGRYEQGESSPSVAWVLSVGSDKRSPSREFKGDLAIPNEDGLLVLEEGERVLLAVGLPPDIPAEDHALGQR